MKTDYMAELASILARLGKYYRHRDYRDVWQVMSVEFRPRDEVLNTQPEPLYKLRNASRFGSNTVHVTIIELSNDYIETED